MKIEYKTAVFTLFSKVLTDLKKVNFTHNSFDVSFDINGDPVARYELVNWKRSESGIIEIVAVGLYDASLPEGQEFQIYRNIAWMDESTNVT